MKISHTTVGRTLTQAEFESDSTHTIGGTADLNVVRCAGQVVAASNALAQSKVMADQDACDGTADDVQIQAALDE